MSPEQLERLEFDRLTEWSKEAAQLLNVAIDRPMIDQSKEYQVSACLMNCFFFSLVSSPFYAREMALH